MHAGKSTLAKFFIENGYAHAPFAGPLKKITAEMVDAMKASAARHVGGLDPWYGFSMADLTLEKDRYRVLMQYVGEYFRQNDENFWVEAFGSQWGDYTGTIVVDDLRHYNEAIYLGEIGYYLVRVERPEMERIESIQKSYERNVGRRLKKGELKELRKHPSERYVDDIVVDEVLFNNGDIDDLRLAAAPLLAGGVIHQNGV